MHRVTVYCVRWIGLCQEPIFSSTRRALLNRNMVPHCYVMGTVREKSPSKTLPLLTATPSRALLDELIVIRGRHLPPRWPITLHASMRGEDGYTYEAHAHYHTDDRGTVDLTRDEAERGSYTGREPMGLFWSLQTRPGEIQGLSQMKRSVETPHTVALSVLSGHVSSCMSTTDAPSRGWEEGHQLATVTVERWYMAPGVRRVDVREGGLVATLFLPPGPGPFPAVLDLWGLRGGLTEHRSALLASRGIASLALAFFEHKEIDGPRGSVNVGDSYFETAFQFLQRHPQVCDDRVGILSQCFGFHIALHLATQTSVNPRFVIAVNGMLEGLRLFTAKGKTRSIFLDGTDWRYDEQGRIILRDLCLPKNIDPEHKAKIGKLSCPLLLVVAEDDLACASREIADEIEERLQATGQSHLLTRVSYPGAGHLIEPPFSPVNLASPWIINSIQIFAVWGGYPASHAAAQEDAWKKVLDFLDCHLRGHN